MTRKFWCYRPGLVDRCLLEVPFFSRRVTHLNTRYRSCATLGAFADKFLKSVSEDLVEDVYSSALPHASNLFTTAPASQEVLLGGPCMRPCCLNWDPAKVRKAQYFDVNPDKYSRYLRFNLGTRKHKLGGGTVSVPVYVHQLIAFLVFGPPPEEKGWDVMHLCNNKRCISLWHLLYGTHWQNRTMYNRLRYHGEEAEVDYGLRAKWLEYEPPPRVDEEEEDETPLAQLAALMLH